MHEDAPPAPGAVLAPPVQLRRATRKRLASLREDLAARLVAHPPRAQRPEAGPAALGVAMQRLVLEHRASGDPQLLAEARRVAGDAASLRAGDARPADLASLGLGLLAVHDATATAAHLDNAERLANALRRLEVGRGGFKAGRDAPKDDLGLADNGLAARFLVALAWRIGGRGGHRDAAEKAVRRLGTPAVLDAALAATPDGAAGLPELLAAVDALLAEPLHATVVGPWEDPAVGRLHRACLRLPHEPVVLGWSLPGDDYPGVGAACVYLTRGSRCASPAKDEAQLLAVAGRLASG